MAAAITGAVFPDFDLFWFYLIDNRSIHHHRYWVHAPIFWIFASAIIIPVLMVWGKTLLKLFLVFLAGIYLHIALDTIAGGIMWFWPYSGYLYEMVTVQPTHKHFILSFMAHWTFLLEIAVWLAALVVIIRAR